MLPNIVNQLGPEGFASLRKLAMEKVGEEAKLETPKDDDVPELEGDFEEASKQEEAEAKTEVSLKYHGCLCWLIRIPNSQLTSSSYVYMRKSWS